MSQGWREFICGVLLFVTFTTPVWAIALLIAALVQKDFGLVISAIVTCAVGALACVAEYIISDDEEGMNAP